MHYTGSDGKEYIVAAIHVRYVSPASSGAMNVDIELQGVDDPQRRLTLEFEGAQMGHSDWYCCGKFWVENIAERQWERLKWALCSESNSILYSRTFVERAS